MDEIERLKVLVQHWRDHNNEHANTYDNWVQKVRIAGNNEAESILMEISSRTKELNSLFTNLEDILS